MLCGLMLCGFDAVWFDAVWFCFFSATAAGNDTCPSFTDLLLGEPLNCSEECLEQSGVLEFNITSHCAMQRPFRPCVRQSCISQNQECTAIYSKICNGSNLGIAVARLCFQQCDPDSNNSLASSMCDRVAIMNCRRSRIDNETLNCARRCRRRRNCVSISQVVFQQSSNPLLALFKIAVSDKAKAILKLDLVA